MFYFYKDKICFSNEKKHLITSWLSDIAKKDTELKKQIINAIDGKNVSFNGVKTESYLKDGKICFADDTLAPQIAVCYVLAHGLTICKCEQCGILFSPVTRSDEKYCSKCRKIGATKQFRLRKADDEEYTLFIKYTKHLRYLKSKDKLTEREFASRYADAKQSLKDVKDGLISFEDFKSIISGETKATPKKPERKMESYLL